jgi:hypothetical protein
VLRSSKDIEGCAIGANDGQIGYVTDLYFDDQAWIVRYLVVATGSWLAGRKVLISPVAIDRTQWLRKALTWVIRYLIANTSTWWLGHQVLIVPQWIDSVSSPESRVFVNLTRRAIQEAPPYDV